MRVMIATNALVGHFRPLLPFADALRRAGHELLVVAPESFGPNVTREGLPFRPCPEPSPASLAAVRAAVADLPPDEALVRMGAELMGRLGPRAALPALTEVIESWRPHLLLRETAELASLLAAEHADLPHATVRIEQAAVVDAGLRTYGHLVAERRAEAGLPPDPELSRLRNGTILSLVPLSLEDPQHPGSALRFRLPRRPAAPAPSWLPPGDDPAVYLSFGTVAGADRYAAAIEALAPLPIRLVVGLGNTGDPSALGPLPGNVQVRRWMPQEHAMQYAAAMVCHGGAGTVLTGLTYGVPMAVLPIFGDQPINGARVAALGAGIVAESIGALPEAIKALLSARSYRTAAARVATEIEQLRPIDEAVAVLFRLARNNDITRPSA